MRDLVLAILDDDQAIDVRLVDMRSRSGFADYMIIASGRALRHVAAMADHLSQKLKAAGLRGLAVEGLRQGDWVLIDAGDVVIHLFRPEVRAYYDLERLWESDPPADSAQHTTPAAPSSAAVNADDDPRLADGSDD
ncbi:MAG: ribosome silencing factor [Alphaproteobacteria bacterium]